MGRFLYAYTQGVIVEIQAIVESELRRQRGAFAFAVTAGDGVGFDSDVLRAGIERIEAHTLQAMDRRRART